MVSSTEIVRIKCGVIFILSNDKLSLICNYCGGEFFTLNEFGVHLNEHFPEKPRKIKTEIFDYESTPPELHNSLVDTIQTDAESLSTATYEKPGTSGLGHQVDEQQAKVIGEVQSDSVNEKQISMDSNEKEHPRTRSTRQAEQLKKIIHESLQLAVVENEKDATGATDSSEPNIIKPHPSSVPKTPDVVSDFQKIRKKGFQCSYCPRIYRQRRDHINHENSHSGKRPYQCEICSKTFPGALNLHQHKMVHSDILPHKCSVCKKQFRSTFLLNVHNRKHHLPDTDPKRYFHCKDCDVICKSYSQLGYHRQHTHLKKDPAAYICDYCQRQFPTRKNITEHMIRHSQVKIYKCQFCDRAYPYRNSKSKHERTQHRDIPF